MAINVLQKQLSVASDATSASLVAVNAAFLQEIKDVHQELWELLEETRVMCRKSHRSSSWQYRFSIGMEELRDLFGLHFALEEGFGYFDNPAFVDLDVSKRANELRFDHQKLYCEISDICELIDELRHSGKLSESMPTVRIRFESFYDQLNAHESREQELIFDSFCSDIGTGD